MAISEIPTSKAPKNKKRQRIFIHSEKLDEFAKVFSEIAGQIKNAT